MGTRLTPLGLVLKWLLVPAALGTAGYFLIGPEIGKNPLAKKVGRRIGLPVPKTADEPKKGSSLTETPDAEEKDPPRSGPEPEVEVSAERVERRRLRSGSRDRREGPPRRKRRRRRTRSVETQARTFVPPVEHRLG